MLSILTITTPIFLIVALGVIAAKRNTLGEGAGPVLSRFVVTFALPATIFHALSRVPVYEIVQWNFLVAYGIGAVSTALIVILVARILLGHEKIFATLQGFGAAMPNTIFFGLPVLIQLFGQAPTSAFAMALIVENVVIFAPMLLLLQTYRDHNGATLGRKLVSVLVQIVKSPIMLAIIGGVLVSALGVPVPGVLRESLALVANASAAVALFAIGFAIARGSLGMARRASSIGLVVSAKLLLQPLIVLIIVLLMPDFDPTLQVSVVVLSAMPMFSIFPIIAAGFGHEKDTLAILLVAVVLSFFTISGWLWVVGRLFAIA